MIAPCVPVGYLSAAGAESPPAAAPSSVHESNVSHHRMSALNAPKQISTRQELREDRVVTVYARAWEFFDQNRTLVYGALAALVLLALAVVAYAFYLNQQQEEAVVLLGTPVRAYEAGNYQAALEGTEGAPGLLAIIDEYGGTEAANLARFYAADALYRTGELDQALELFQDYDREENFIGASALAGEAAIYESRGDFDRAAEYYRRAALLFENELTTPQYLLNAGRAYEAAGDYAAAIAAYEEVRDRFPESPPATAVDFFIARAEAKQNS